MGDHFAANVGRLKAPLRQAFNDAGQDSTEPLVVATVMSWTPAEYEFQESVLRLSPASLASMPEADFRGVLAMHYMMGTISPPTFKEGGGWRASRRARSRTA